MDGNGYMGTTHLVGRSLELVFPLVEWSHEFSSMGTKKKIRSK